MQKSKDVVRVHHEDKQASPLPGAGDGGGVDVPVRSCDEEPKGLFEVHLETPSALVTAKDAKR